MALNPTENPVWALNQCAVLIYGNWPPNFRFYSYFWVHTEVETKHSAFKINHEKLYFSCIFSLRIAVCVCCRVV